MAERTIVRVEGDTNANDLPEISYIGYLTKEQDPETSYPDGFRDLDVSRVNELVGTSGAFKRSVTNTIRKFQRGIDGAETKQINEKQFETAYDAFDVMPPPYNLDYLAKLYAETSPTHYAAVNAKVANIVGLGFKLVETNKAKKAFEDIADNEKKTKKIRQELNQHLDDLYEMVETFNEEDTFVEILVKVWRDYEATGNGYLEIGRKKDGSVGFIGHIPSKTMRIRRLRDGFVQISGWKTQFFAHFGAGINDQGKPVGIKNPVGNDQPNEVIHIKKYSPISGYYGIPDIIAALQAVAGNEFASRFNLDYFENKAIPRYAIILKGATLSASAQLALLSLFENDIKGQNHRSVFIPLPADTDNSKTDIKFEAIEAGNQDSSFMNYKKANDADILMVHRVPVTKVSVAQGTNLAIARDADKTFKEQVCAPEQRIFEKKVNAIFKELTDSFEFKLNEMTLTDADTQSKIDERNVKTGIDLPNEVRSRDGKPGIKGGNERVDLNAKTNAQTAAQQNTDANANRQRNSARSANATDTAGNARNPKGDGRTTP